MLKLKGVIFTENTENKVIDDEMMAKDTLFSIDQLLQSGTMSRKRTHKIDKF